MPYKRIGERDSLATYFFYVRFNGVRHRKQVSCPRSAVRDVYRKWESEVFSGAAIGRRLLFETLDEYLSWAEKHKAPLMVVQEQRDVAHAKTFFKNVEISSIKRHHIQDFRAWRMEHGVKSATVNRTLCTISYFFNWCRDREYATSNPVFKVKLKDTGARVVTLSSEQVNELVSAANDYQKRWLMLALFTGMRRGEILSLKWTSVDLKANLIRIEAENSKSKRARVIDMPQELNEYLGQVRIDEPFAQHVLTYRGSPIENNIKRSWQALRNSVPFAKNMSLRFHDLRHVYATILRTQAVPLDIVQELLGHQDIRTTQRYAHYDGSRRKAYVNRISEFLKEPKGG